MNAQIIEQTNKTNKQIIQPTKTNTKREQEPMGIGLINIILIQVMG